MADPELKILADSSQVIKEFEKLQGQVEASKAKIRELTAASRDSQRGARDAGGAFTQFGSEAVHALKGVLAGFTTIGGLAATVRAEMQNTAEVHRKAADVRLGAADPQKMAILNFGASGATAEERQKSAERHLQRLTEIGRRQNVPMDQIYDLASTAFSVKGALPDEAAYSALEESTKLAGRNRELANALIVGSLDLSRATGETNAALNLGMMATISQQSHVSDWAALAQYAAPAVAGVVSTTTGLGRQEMLELPKVLEAAGERELAGQARSMSPERLDFLEQLGKLENQIRQRRAGALEAAGYKELADKLRAVDLAQPSARDEMRGIEAALTAVRAGEMEARGKPADAAELRGIAQQAVVKRSATWQWRLEREATQQRIAMLRGAGEEALARKLEAPEFLAETPAVPTPRVQDLERWQRALEQVGAGPLAERVGRIDRARPGLSPEDVGHLRGALDAMTRAGRTAEAREIDQTLTAPAGEALRAVERQITSELTRRGKRDLVQRFREAAPPTLTRSEALALREREAGDERLGEYYRISRSQDIINQMRTAQSRLANEAAALFNSLTFGMADKEGRRARTAAQNFARQLADFLPEEDVFSEKLDPKTMRYKRVLEAKGTGLRTTHERLAYLWAHPDLQRRFLGKASFESAAEMPLRELVSGQEGPLQMVRKYRGDVAATPAGPEMIGLLREKQAQISSTPENRLARLARVFDVKTEELLGGDAAGAVAGVLEEKLPKHLKALGLSATQQKLANLMTGAGILPAEDKLSGAISVLELERRRLSQPTERVYETGGADIFPSERPRPMTAAETQRLAKVDEFIATLKEILAEMQRRGEQAHNNAQQANQQRAEANQQREAGQRRAAAASAQGAQNVNTE